MTKDFVSWLEILSRKNFGTIFVEVLMKNTKKAFDSRIPPKETFCMKNRRIKSFKLNRQCFFFSKHTFFLSLQLNTAFDELILKECYLKGAFSLTHTQFNCAKNSISHFLFISLRKNGRKKMSFRLSGLNLISHISFDGSHFNRLPNWTKHRIT